MAKAFSQRGLTYKQISLTLLVTLLVSGGVTAIQTWVSLGEEREAAETKMTLLLKSARGNAAAAAFRLDTDLAEYVTGGLATSSVIAQATIHDENGGLLATRTIADESSSPGWLVNLAYGDLLPLKEPLFSLVQPDSIVGTITVHPDRNALAFEFLSGLRDSVLLDAAKAVLLALVLSVMFYYALTQPLLRLAEAIRQVSPGKDLRLSNLETLRERDDEFSNLVTSFEGQLLMFKVLLEERDTLLGELRLRNAAIASMDSGLMIVDSGTTEDPVVDANAAIAEMMGVPVENIIGHQLLELVDRDKRSAGEYQHLTEFIKRGLTGDAVSEVFEFFDQQDETLWCKMSIIPVTNESGEFTHRVVILNDITKARETEEKLRHSQKMDALGKVAGGIAHDFNNMLAIMKGNLEVANLDFAEHTEFQQNLQPISRAVDRAAELTRRLLRFSRKTPIQEHDVCIDELILQMEEMLRSSLTPEIAIRLELNAPDSRVRIDRGDLEDALLNLAVNARDAMPQGGTLTFATQKQTPRREDETQQDQLLAGEYLCLTVTDTGTGMSESTLKRLFEPFFTTKGESRGTGLGLSQVYGFVDRSGGNIKVQSQPGAGSQFRLYLPLEAGPETGIDEVPVAGNLPTGTETILVVDDEPELLKAARKILEHLGYTVLTSEQSSHAIELFKENTSDIKLLLSDVVMPGNMSGYELAAALKTIQPHLKVLMASGYDSRQEAGTSEYSLLAKPYSTEMMARYVRATLDGKAVDRIRDGF